MSRFLRAFVFVAIAFSFLLAGCGTSAAPTATEAMPATQAPASAAMPASTATPTPLAPGSVTLNGSGSTFQAPAESEYAFAFPLVDPAVVINYQPTGSGAGIKAITDGTVDFAGSDAVLNPDQVTAGKDLQMYPFLAGATVMTYNIPELDPTKDPPLILDGSTLVGIYNATITKWNDPAIAALNPQIASKLPAKQITVAHRSDGSGTTAIFTAALTSFSSAWTAGSGTTINWPADKAGNGVGGNGNQGVTAAVQNTPESIGYVEYAYAVSNKLPFAQMVNKAGKTVTATPDSTASAMNDFANSFTPQLTNTIVNGSGDASWPIAGYTYIIIHQTSMTDCVKASKLVEYINWILTNPVATSRAKALGYVPLPAAVQQLALAKLGQVTCSGQPVMVH
ncbi:MAG TPA: phosphate ABC transporter substrate-binding protein PstS [Anaerolineales bacterium]|nr:phosphate ABC transporter substrate-binding protein PstS [Anaerolineales bacterium]